MVDGVAPLDLNQTPPSDFPWATDAEMVDGVGVASSENQIPPTDPHSPSAIAIEMADGDLNEIRPPDHPSSSSAAPHQPLSPEHWTTEEHGIFLLGMELFASGNWMVDGVGVASSENQIPPPDAHCPPAIAIEMADGIASIDLNEIRPPDHPSSSSAAPHQPLSPEHWTREEHGIFLLGMELYGVGNWKEICEYGRMTKTPAQLESHAREYFFAQWERYPRLEEYLKSVVRGTRRESMYLKKDDEA